MADQRERIYFAEGYAAPCKVVKLKVSKGCTITIGQVLVQYECDSPSNPIENAVDTNKTNTSSKNHVIRANCAGIIEQIFIKEGDVLVKGTPILEYSCCSHPTVMKDMCAECGADLREVEQRNQKAAVAMVHNIPELMVSVEEAQLLGKADEERLLRDRKLVLLVDLDQTLIHTTNDPIPPNIKDVFHFQLHGNLSPWYHTRLRPFTKDFLENMSSLYELHICTFGSRTYAHKIAEFLDEEGRYFSHRILSRDECFSSHSKMANLKALFPCGDHMVVIIDDREDVWNFAPNLIHVRPYHFFQHTGDINAPPGLGKKEFDDKEGFDFSTLKTGENEKLASQQPTPETKEPSQSEDQKERIPNPETPVEPQEGAEESIVDPEKCNGQSVQSLVEKDDSNPNTEAPESDTSSDVANPSSKDVTKVMDGEQISDNIESLTLPLKEKSECDAHCLSDEELSERKSLDQSPDVEEKKADENQEQQRAGNQVIEVDDTDDYLLHLQDILRTIHHAYYEIYDEKREGNLKRDVPDMKRILPYVRRKVLQDVRLVFSGVVPTNITQEKSRPYLVARSLGAHIMDAVDESTTHVIAARLGTAKLNEAKKFKHIQVVTPDWLWCCAERWEHVEERLFPLNADTAAIRRKPPAHCTSPDVALQLAMAAGTKEDQEVDLPVYDRVTGKRVFRKTQKRANEKGKAWTAIRSSRQSSERPQRRFSETFNPLLSFSSEDIANMDREVEDILHEKDETDDDDEEEIEEESEPPPVKRHHVETVGSLIIGDVSEPDDPENESILNLVRHGEPIPEFEPPTYMNPSDAKDLADDEEDANAAELEELEPDEDLDDSEWCLAGQALEREFLSGEED